MSRSKSAVAEKKLRNGDANGQQGADARNRADRRFHDALKNLPDTATPTKELDWIKNHAKMTEHDRSEDPNHRVVLSCKDIKVAPSQHAAQALQHWVNRPNEFFKNMLNEDKKRHSAVEVDAQSETSPEILRIDEMLALIDCAVPPDATKQG
jgi:hypothetical protein